MSDRLGNRESTSAYNETAFAATASAPTKSDPWRIDSEGSLHIRELTIPPSDLWSSEFKKFYAATLTEDSWTNWPIPARTSSKAEWDKFDAWLDERFAAEPLAAALNRYPVDVSEMSVGGVRAAMVSPKDGITDENKHRVLINLHGGGFVVNRGLMGGQLESIPVASIGRIKVITLDYRQAPFHRYPAASEDVQAVYIELLKQYEPESIGIYGFSAGGVLATQAIARFQNIGLPRPGAVGIFGMAPPPPYSLVQPWGPGWGDSGVWFSGTPRNQPSDIERTKGEITYWYMEGADINDPSAYPGTSDAVLAKFPPTLFLSGTRDFAVSTVIVAHTRFLRLGVDSSLYIIEGGPHGAHVAALGTPEAHDAHVYTARWFGEHLRQ